MLIISVHDRGRCKNIFGGLALMSSLSYGQKPLNLLKLLADELFLAIILPIQLNLQFICVIEPSCLKVIIN